MFTLPFGTGVVTAFIFAFLELFLIPILMHATSTLASIFVVKHVAKGKTVLVKPVRYPLWNEGLFQRQASHAALFLIRLVCLSIPVYLETRFISESNRLLVSKVLPSAYIPEPKDLDVTPSQISNDIFNSHMFPTELFYRCTFINDDGWLVARTVNVTDSRPDRRNVQCVKDSEQIIYRNLERLQPYQQFSDGGSISLETPIVKLEVRRDEGLFKAFPPWPGIKSKPHREFVQVKNVTVLSAIGLECSFWRSPLELNFDASESHAKHNSFVCQNVTMNVVDYFFVSTADMLQKSNANVWKRSSNGGMVTKSYTVSVDLQFIGSLEFKDRILVSAATFIRQAWTPDSTHGFPSALRTMLYTRTNNYTVNVPGNKIKESVRLDNVVLIVGSAEVVSILALWVISSVYQEMKRKSMQKINTVDGLSRCWWRNRAEDVGSTGTGAPISLRLKHLLRGGVKRTLYVPVDLV
ncbi:unnamed protein product [Agarophyton chilense]